MEAFCPCGMLAVQRTAWTETNYGRRFLGCVYGAKGCNYFRWVDPPTCPRCCSMIPGLVRKNAEHEGQVKKLQEEKKALRKWIIIILGIMFVWLVFVK